MVEHAFGIALRAARMERGLSQERLARESDLHRNHVGLLERGEKGPSLRAVFSLADALGVRPSELVLRVEEQVEVRRPARAAEPRSRYEPKPPRHRST